MVSKNTKKSTSTSVHRLQSWFKEKHGKQINLDAISKQEAPQLLKHFFLEIRQTTKENKGKEYEPGTLQTYPSIASLDGKFTNSSGHKTVIQALRDDFNPLEISELTGHANSQSISSYSHNPLEKQRRMSNKLAGFNPSTTTTNSDSSHALREIVLNSSAPPSNTAATSNRDSSASRSSYLMAGAVGGMFTGVTFNNSPVNISINFQSNMTPASDSLQ